MEFNPEKTPAPVQSLTMNVILLFAYLPIKELDPLWIRGRKFRLNLGLLTICFQESSKAYTKFQYLPQREHSLCLL